VRQRISAARKRLILVWATLRAEKGSHKILVHPEAGGTAATCTCVDEIGDAWYFWHESPLIVAQQVHLHLVPDELLHG